MLRRIAVHLAADEACERRLDAGLKLAAEHGAELVGVYTSEGSLGATREISALPSDIRQNVRARREELRNSVHAMFIKKCEKQDVAYDWREPRRPMDESLALHARYADLMIMGQLMGTSSSLMPNLVEAVIMAAGRPVLVIPAVGTFPSIGKNILFCWDQRREAARAFADAAPFLRRCEQLVVLEIDRQENLFEENDLRAEDISHYCTSLGYPKPNHLVEGSHDFGVGNVILNTTTDQGNDLIVMGAYGHSRMRQWIMGGASRTLLASMTIPVLLSN